MSTDQIIAAFEKVCGTVEEYGGDKSAWAQDFAVFCLGWHSCVELSAQHSMEPTLSKSSEAVPGVVDEIEELWGDERE